MIDNKQVIDDTRDPNSSFPIRVGPPLGTRTEGISNTHKPRPTVRQDAGDGYVPPTGQHGVVADIRHAYYLAPPQSDLFPWQRESFEQPTQDFHRQVRFPLQTVSNIRTTSLPGHPGFDPPGPPPQSLVEYRCIGSALLGAVAAGSII